MFDFGLFLWPIRLLFEMDLNFRMFSALSSSLRLVAK